jgi:hypothetical protein
MLGKFNPVLAAATAFQAIEKDRYAQNPAAQFEGLHYFRFCFFLRMYRFKNCDRRSWALEFRASPKRR